MKTFIGKYNSGKIIKIEEIKAGNFNSVKEIFEKIKQAYNKLYEYNEQDIIIDITGGTKPVSIAGL